MLFNDHCYFCWLTVLCSEERLWRWYDGLWFKRLVILVVVVVMEVVLGRESSRMYKKYVIIVWCVRDCNAASVLSKSGNPEVGQALLSPLSLLIKREKEWEKEWDDDEIKGGLPPRFHSITFSRFLPTFLLLPFLLYKVLML